MNTTNNQRARITMLLFQDRLVSLLAEGRTIDTITITELCKSAGLNRGTFYAHYRVPKDILDELEEDTYRQFTAYIAALNRTNDVERLTQLLKYIRSNRVVYYVLFSQNGSTAFVNRIVASVLSELSDLNQYIKDPRLIPYLYSFLIHGSEHMVLDWLHADFDIEEQKLAATIFSLCKAAVATLAY